MATLKKKVTLKTKVADAPTDTKLEVPESNPENKGNERLKWIGIVAILAVVVAVVFFLLKPEKADDTIIALDDVPPQQEVVDDVEIFTQQIEGQNDVSETSQEENALSDMSVVNDNSTETSQEENALSDMSVVNDNSSETIALQDNPLPTVESNITSPKESEISSETIEAKAWLVIRGDFGNGEERKIKLGSDYSLIQNKVNEMYKNGLVH